MEIPLAACTRDWRLETRNRSTGPLHGLLPALSFCLGITWHSILDSGIYKEAFLEEKKVFIRRLK